MNVLILGGDGFLGWPTALRFSRLGDRVTIADNFLRRRLHRKRGTGSLTPIATITQRLRAWNRKSPNEISFHRGDLVDPSFVFRLIRDVRPEIVIHYGEIPSAPYSMIDVRCAAQTQENNVTGTLNVLFALREFAPDAHLIKLGTMGEYGTPNIDIEEGFLEVEHRGRKDILPFPKQPGSFYHLSKVHDSHNIMFACRTWGLRSTDLNQGVVYGIQTDETASDERLITRFDYDAVFGTVLNRFCVQAVIGHPLTVYGRGGQRRGFLNIEDTLQCVLLSAENPPEKGEYRVFNQFTEIFSVTELADLVRRAAGELGISVEVQNLVNPRREREDHYYNPVAARLPELGLVPRTLSETLIRSVFGVIEKYRDRIDRDAVAPRITWMKGEKEAAS